LTGAPGSTIAMPISDQRMSARRDLPAGGFSCWLRRTLVALTEEGEADVPCGECSACCTTSHFVHLGPEETRTLARIPRELLFPAPGDEPGATARASSDLDVARAVMEVGERLAAARAALGYPRAPAPPRSGSDDG